MARKDDTAEQLAEQELKERNEERRQFWHDATIPVNESWIEDETNFANPVEVADMFARATGVSAMLASEAEELTEAVANAEFLKDEAALDYGRLRRQILSQNFSAIKSGWNSEAMDAFILASAKDQAPTLLALEKAVEDAAREIRIRKPRLEKIKNRLKRLETTMEWAKQWLDYDKLMVRVTDQKAGKRR